MRFFSSKHVSRPLDSYPKAVSNINSNSTRYLNLKLIPCCGPPPENSIPQCGPSRRIESYDVAPSVGSNPKVWPLPQDRLLRCGPSRRIDSYDVASPAGSNPTGVAPPAGSTLGTRKGQGHGQGQGQGSDFPLWPLPGDRTFLCGPSRRIGLSAVAPPGGLDFLMWPLPGDWTFRCGPSCRIESYGVALPTGSTATPRDRWNIL
jgi:hypothetical protein